MCKKTKEFLFKFTFIFVLCGCKHFLSKLIVRFCNYRKLNTKFQFFLHNGFINFQETKTQRKLVLFIYFFKLLTKKRKATYISFYIKVHNRTLELIWVFKTNKLSTRCADIHIYGNSPWPQNETCALYLVNNNTST